MRPSLTHIAIHSQDIGATIRFYENYCGLSLVHDRMDDGRRVAWLAEPGKEKEFVFVLIDGGPGRPHADADISHFGFAMETRADVDSIAAKADADGILAWPATELPPPVGYFCGVRDPDGNIIEFSHDQPLGPA